MSRRQPQDTADWRRQRAGRGRSDTTMTSLQHRFDEFRGTRAKTRRNRNVQITDIPSSQRLLRHYRVATASTTYSNSTTSCGRNDSHYTRNRPNTNLSLSKQDHELQCRELLGNIDELNRQKDAQLERLAACIRVGTASHSRYPLEQHGRGRANEDDSDGCNQSDGTSDESDNEDDGETEVERHARIRQAEVAAALVEYRPLVFNHLNRLEKLQQVCRELLVSIMKYGDVTDDDRDDYDDERQEDLRSIEIKREKLGRALILVRDVHGLILRKSGEVAPLERKHARAVAKGKGKRTRRMVES